MRGQGLAYRNIEEVLPDQEGEADAPPDSPWPPPPQEEEADTPEDWFEPAPPPVEPADTPVAPDEMEIPQFHEEEAAERKPPILVDPPSPHTGDTTRGGKVASSSEFPSTVGA